MLAVLVEELKKTGLQTAPADHCYAEPEDVACDFCTWTNLKALKYCLVCLACLVRNTFNLIMNNQYLKNTSRWSPPRSSRRTFALVMMR